MEAQKTGVGHRLQTSARLGASGHLSFASGNLLAAAGQGADDDDQQPIQWLAVRRFVARQIGQERTNMAETSGVSLVEYACRDQVATLTLNRPDRLNAF